MNGDHHPVGRPSGESGRAKVDYAELRQRAESATKGEWDFEPQPYGCAVHLGGSTFATTHGTAAITKAKLPHVENAAYIVAAQPSTVLALLDRIEELEGEVEQIRAEATGAHEAEAKAFLAANARAELMEGHVAELLGALKELLALVKATPALQGREHVGLGIRVTNAIHDAKTAIARKALSGEKQ